MIGKKGNKPLIAYIKLLYVEITSNRTPHPDSHTTSGMIFAIISEDLKKTQQFRTCYIRPGMTNELFNRLAFAVSDIDFSVIQLKRIYEGNATPGKDRSTETRELLQALVTDIKTIEANLNDILSKLS